MASRGRHVQTFCLPKRLHNGHPLPTSGILPDVLVLLVQETRGLHDRGRPDCRKTNQVGVRWGWNRKSYSTTLNSGIILECICGPFHCPGSSVWELLSQQWFWPIKMWMSIQEWEPVLYGMAGRGVTIPVTRYEIISPEQRNFCANWNVVVIFSDLHFQHVGVFRLANFAAGLPLHCLIHATLWSPGAEAGISTQSAGSNWIRTGKHQDLRIRRGK